MFTGDGDPNFVTVETTIPPIRGITYILNDGDGAFNKELAEEALVLLRTKMVLDDLADI